MTHESGMNGKQIQRNTPQRRVILEELRKVTSHPTATALYEIVRQRLPKISLGTVYRNLELLADMGVIQKLDLGGSEARFDGNMAPHQHVRCVECGQLGDIYGTADGRPELPQDNLGGFEILDCRMEYVGVCPACQENRVKQET